MRNRLLQVVLATLGCLTVLEGYFIARFSILQSAYSTMATTGVADSAKASAEADEKIAEIERFVVLPGLRGSAREAILSVLSGASFDVVLKEAASVELLRVLPASGLNWLELAKLRSRRLDSHERITSALEMSILTEPREVDALGKRAIFGLEIWGALTESQKKAILSQLSEAGAVLEKGSIRELKLVISNLSETSRHLIKEQLLSISRGEKRWMKTVGL
jgi:hypothetical protein